MISDCPGEGRCLYVKNLSFETTDSGARSELYTPTNQSASQSHLLLLE